MDRLDGEIGKEPGYGRAGWVPEWDLPQKLLKIALKFKKVNIQSRAPCA